MEGDKENSNSISDSSAMPKISSFKDLRKPTMKETYQYVCTLIDGKKNEDVESFKELILPKTPLSLFDECLMLTVIDMLKLEKEVIKILLSQNDGQIKRILGCKWFFKNLPLEFCASEIFPYVSASLRCKIINKLSKHLEDKDEAEKYFAFVRKNYDSQRADYLLPKCSGEFILMHFEEHKSILKHPAELRILLAICKRYPGVGLHLLEQIFILESNPYALVKYSHIVQYLAGNHHDLFLPFLRKYHSLLKLSHIGRKVTKKIGRKIREDFLSDAIGILPLKTKVLFSMLSFEERVKFLANLLRQNAISEFSLRTWTYSKYDVCKYVKMIKPEDRLVYVERTFKELYDVNLNSNSKYWSRELLEVLPIESRKPLLLKMEKFFSEEESVFDNNMDSSFFIRSPEGFIQLYEFGTAFERLKEMLRTAPLPSRRKDIIDEMVNNCSINSDLNGLQQVIDYVVTRHRNDDCKILYNIIQTILDKFPSSALTSGAIEKLDELFHLCALRSEPPTDVHIRWKERHIYHLMENGLDVDAQLKNYFEDVFLKRCYGAFVGDYNCRHSKTLLVKLCQMAVTWINSNPSDSSSHSLFRCTIETCVNFSKTKAGGRVWGEIPGLRELLLEKLKSNYREAGGEEWPLDVWEKYPNHMTDSNFSPNCLLYVLTRKPHLVDKHLEGIMNCLMSTKGYVGNFKTYRNCFNFVLRAASFYGKTERIKELLLKEFKSGNSLKKREIALALYSQMSTIEEFSEVVEEYIPKQERIEVQSDVNFTKIQLLIPTLIINVRPRWRNFDLILKFFKGDFLSRIRPTLHACAHYTRVDVVVPFLKNHLETLPQRISYLKDIIRLIAELSTHDETLDFCLEFWEKHNHYTIRTILFYYVSKLFVERPTRDSFEVVKKCVMESDPVIIGKMPSLDSVPDEYLEEYVDTLMRFSEGQSVAFRNDCQNSVLKHFHGKKIKVLSPDFSERIIKSHLFNSGSGLNMKQFACFYLKEGPNSSESRARLIFDTLSRNKPPPMEVLEFLGMLRATLMPDLIAVGDIFQVVLDNWPEYPTGTLYEERLMYVYCSLYQKASQRSPDPNAPTAEFAKELRELYSSVENLRDVVVIFGEALKKFLENFGAEKAVSMIGELVAGPKERNVAIAGIWALPKKAIFWFRSDADECSTKRKMMDDLFKVFESYDDAVVEIYLRGRFYGWK